MGNNIWRYTDLLFEHVLGKSMPRGIADTVLCSEKRFGHKSED